MLKLYKIAIVLTVSLAACQTLPNSMTSPATPQTISVNTLTSVEKAVYEQVNQYRQSQGLPPLELNPRIVEQARQHSQKMAQGGVSFGHEGFEERTHQISQVIAYRRTAENVAFNQGFSDPATQAMKGWLNSSSHRQNIEGEFNLTGVGISQNAAGEYYFTQIFVLER